MAKNLTINGQNYSAVPSVQIPITGGGTASFVDISDTTATAADVNSGKYLYLANGTKTQGSQTVYDVTKTLTKTTISNSASKVLSGGYYAKLTPDSGYFISSVTVRMGGADITSQVFSGVGDGFSVTTDLKHFYITNVVSTKTSFRAELVKEQDTVNEQVTITMGGTDVSNYYSSGVINIPNVTGDIVITATATAATVSSISAIFTQGQNVIYTSDSLDDLRQYLTVTATYTGGVTSIVTGYTLSGTLAVGTSTITVSYSGKTTTFTVTVSAPSREMLFGVFTDGYAVSKSTSGSTQNKIYRSSASARSCPAQPFANDNYTFTVTDSTKYNIAVYDVTDLTHITTGAPAAAVDGYMYQGGTKSISWKTSDSVSTSYAWISLKKLNNTSFTAEELANGAEAVFTYTSGT